MIPDNILRQVDIYLRAEVEWINQIVEGWKIRNMKHHINFDHIVAQPFGQARGSLVVKTIATVDGIKFDTFGVVASDSHCSTIYTVMDENMVELRKKIDAYFKDDKIEHPQTT